METNLENSQVEENKRAHIEIIMDQRKNQKGN
jgi:hypothetical protein